MSFPAKVPRVVTSSIRGRGSFPPFPAGGGFFAPSSGGGEPDWRSLFERERRRAEELRRGEIGWRAKVGRLQRLLAAAGVDARKRSTIVSLRMEVETRRTRIGELEAELAKLRASRAVHAKARFGRKSERRERAGSDRPRGQQAGAVGHGRTPRPGVGRKNSIRGQTAH